MQKRDEKGRKQGGKARKNVKDGMFRALFHDEEKLVELYNALSGSSYPKGTPVEIITLENAIFGDIKNDLAFIIDSRLIILIEHQSTVNPNMPLRMFCYIAREYERLLYSRGIYSRKAVRIPTPELYVFYNGAEEQPLEQEMKLSDAFIEKCGTINAELIVRVINVNYEKGAAVLKKCRLLAEYSRFVHMVRSLQAEGRSLQAALEESIEICRERGILKDFLKRNGGDVMSFLFEELTAEECLAIREEDGYYRGLEEGEARGEAKCRAEVARNLKRADIPAGVIAENTGLTIEEIDAL